MSFESARQLAQLADKMQSLSSAGSISEEDRETITHAALGIAGISTDDVNNAIAQMMKDGNQKAIDNLMNKAATNLGCRPLQDFATSFFPLWGSPSNLSTSHLRA